MFCDGSIDFMTQGQVQDQQNLEPMGVPMSLPIASYFNQIIKDVPSKYFKPRRFQTNVMSMEVVQLIDSFMAAMYL